MNALLSAAAARRGSAALALVLLSGVFGLGPERVRASVSATGAAGPALELTKTADAASVEAGDPIGFRIDLTNHDAPPNVGRVVIVNRTYPEWITNSYTYEGDLGSSGFVVANSIRTFAALAPGAYTTRQATAPANTHLESIVCDNGEVGDALTGELTVHLQTGQVVRCVFTNRSPRGRVIIENRTFPQWLNNSYTYEGDLGSSGFVVANGSRSFSALPPGTYMTRQASAPANTHLQSITCDNGESGNPLTGELTIHLQADQVVRCVFTNRSPRGRVIIENRTYPSSITNNQFFYDGDLGSDGTIFPNSTRAFPALPPGTYTLDQTTTPAGVQLESIVCSDGGTGDPATGVVEIDLQADEVVRCVFTNRNPTASLDGLGLIAIENQAPAAAAQHLNAGVQFSQNVAFPNPLFIAGGTDSRFRVAPGTYTVTELAPTHPNFFHGVTCTDGNSSVDVGERRATIQLEPNEIVRCVFVNENRRGAVILENQAPAAGAPNADAAATFQHPFSGANPLFLGSGDHTVHRDVAAPGTYTITELAPIHPVFFHGVQCTDGGAGNGSTATVELEPYAVVRCSFVNENRRGLVVFENQAPAGASGGPLLTYEQNLAASPTLQLQSGADSVHRNVAAPGAFRITQLAAPPPALFHDVSCDDANSAATDATRTADVQLEPYEIVRCVFVNSSGPLTDNARTVTLVDDLPSAPGLEWSLETPVPGCSITNGRLSCTFAELADAQKVSLHVTSPSTNASCGKHDNTVFAEASNRARVTATASVEVVCSATIVVRKATAPQSAQAFAFTGAVAGSIAPGGELRAEVGPGEHTVAEAELAGWDLTDVDCDDADSTRDLPTRTATFRVAAGETVVCTFTNTQRGTIVVEKAPGPTGLFPFTGDAAGTIPAGGRIAIGNLRPGTYTSTEKDPGPLYALGSIQCDDANSTGDVPSRTATFRLDAGETVLCVFANRALACPVTASPPSLWPPNHRLVPVTLSAGNGLSLAILGVTQDEPIEGLGDGDMKPDAVRSTRPNEVLLRAERSGLHDGRVYHVEYRVQDSLGRTCTASIPLAVVPHDQGQGEVAIDSAPPSYDSFGP